MAKKRTLKTPYTSIYFHVELPLEKELKSRAELSADVKALALIAKRDVTRYYVILRETLHRLNFTQNEALFLCEILKDAKENMTPEERQNTDIKHLETFVSLFPKPQKNAAAALGINAPSLSQYLNGTTPIGAKLRKQMRDAGYDFETRTIQKKQVDINPHSLTVQLVNIHTKASIADKAVFVKWNIEQDSFLANLLNLTPAETMAICDAVERFWKDNHQTLGTPENPYEERLQKAGLLKEIAV